LQWLCAAVALASWDLFLDPQMVAAHHWRWLHVSPSLPGIGDVPLTNFGGWLLVSLLVMAVLVPLSRTEQSRDDRPALTLWVWTWLSSGLANLAFFDRPAVAVWGLLAMGTVGIPLVHRLRVRPT
jgi:putative membrane protein